MRISALILAAPLTIAMLAAADKPKRSDNRTVADYTAGLVADQSTLCMPSRLPSTGLKVDGDKLIYQVSRSLVYVNQTTGGCENVARGDVLVTVSPSGRLCGGDIARTIAPVSRIPTGGCALGQFTRYSKPRS